MVLGGTGYAVARGSGADMPMNEQMVGEARLLRGMSSYELQAVLQAGGAGFNPELVQAEIQFRQSRQRPQMPGAGMQRFMPGAAPAGGVPQGGVPPEAMQRAMPPQALQFQNRPNPALAAGQPPMAPPAPPPPMMPGNFPTDEAMIPPGVPAPDVSRPPMVAPPAPPVIAAPGMEEPPGPEIPPGYSPGGWGGAPTGGIAPDMSLASSGRDAIMAGSDQALQVAGIGEDDPKRDALMALAKAGFGMAAGRSPSGIQNIAGGALLGLSDYEAARERAVRNQLRNQQIQLQHQDRQERTAARREDSAYRNAVLQQNADTAKARLDELILQHADQKSIKEAQTDYYRAMAKRAEAEARATDENRRGAGGKGQSVYQQKLETARSIYPDNEEAAALLALGRFEKPINPAQAIASAERAAAGQISPQKAEEARQRAYQFIEEHNRRLRGGAPATGAAPTQGPVGRAAPMQAGAQPVPIKDGKVDAAKLQHGQQYMLPNGTVGTWDGSAFQR